MKCSISRFLAKALFVLTIPWVVSGCFTLEYSPDGRRLVFLWATQGKDETIGGMAIANTDGTDLTILPGTREANFGHWSPDCSKVLYSGKGGLWVYDTKSKLSSNLWSEETGDSCWITDSRIVFETLISEEGNLGKLVWYDLDKKAAFQEVPFESSRDISMNFTPVPRTDGIVLVNSGNLVLAEFGEAKQLTTTGDVLGFAIDASKDRVVFARSTKNPQFILMTLWEYDLRLRSVRKLPFPDHVVGINPKPRTGPKELRHVKFSNDLQSMLVFAVPDTISQQKVLIFQDLYWMDIAGNQAKKLVSIHPSNDASGLMAAISPDSNSVAVLYGDKSSLTLSSFDVASGSKRIIKRVIGIKN